MKYIYENVEQELLSLFNSIQTMPENWASWCCLHAEVKSTQRSANAAEIRDVTMKALDNNLAGHDGTVIFLGTSDIYVFASSIEWQRLKNVGHILADNLQQKVGVGIHFAIWDLTSNGRKTADVTDEAVGGESDGRGTPLKVIK